MIAQLAALQTEIGNLGYQCSLTFGRAIESDLTRENIGAGRVVLFFPTLDTSREPMTWQGSPVLWLSGSITTFARVDRDAVQLLHNVLRDLGFQRENGDVGKPARFPRAFGALNFVWLDCPGGVRCAAQQAGDLWAVEQSVEMAYYVT